jgi:hypothetical protein
LTDKHLSGLETILHYAFLATAAIVDIVRVTFHSGIVTTRTTAALVVLALILASVA